MLIEYAIGCVHQLVTGDTSTSFALRLVESYRPSGVLDYVEGPKGSKGYCGENAV